MCADLARPIDAVIFDLDGTLVDTFGLIVASWNAAVRGHVGRDHTPEEVIARFGVPCSAMLRRELPAHLVDDAIEAFHHHYRDAHAMAPAFDGIDDLIARLRARGVPMAVVTGKGRRTTDISLAACRWAGSFPVVITGEDVERQKPDPQGALRAARQLRIAPERCAFVGDSPADIGAGRAAGMVTIVAGWQTVYAEKVRAMQPDVWARMPADVLRAVEGHGVERS
jgi:pyrophosphatase PpaX